MGTLSWALDPHTYTSPWAFLQILRVVVVGSGGGGGGGSGGGGGGGGCMHAGTQIYETRSKHVSLRSHSITKKTQCQTWKTLFMMFIRKIQDITIYYPVPLVVSQNFRASPYCWWHQTLRHSGISKLELKLKHSRWGISFTITEGVIQDVMEEK